MNTQKFKLLFTENPDIRFSSPWRMNKFFSVIQLIQLTKISIINNMN